MQRHSRYPWKCKWLTLGSLKMRERVTLQTILDTIHNEVMLDFTLCNASNEPVSSKLNTIIRKSGRTWLIFSGTLKIYCSVLSVHINIMYSRASNWTFFGPRKNPFSSKIVQLFYLVKFLQNSFIWEAFYLTK